MEGQQVSSFDWHFKKKNPNAHSCFVEARLHCLYFPPSRWEKGPGVGRLPAPAITHPLAIKRESQCGWFVMLALVASSNTAWFKSPQLLFFIFFYPLGKPICRCFSPYWLVFRAPSPIPLPIPQAFLCLSCHVLFFSPVSASNLKETPVFITWHIQSSADFVLAIISWPTFEFKREEQRRICSLPPITAQSHEFHYHTFTSCGHISSFTFTSWKVIEKIP